MEKTADSSTERRRQEQANEDALLDWLADCRHDPLKFVVEGFPWGEEGTDLADSSGPDEWQIAVLTRLALKLITVKEAIQIAVASGHGVGKSALVAWIILWAFCTFPDCKGVITANTDTQLRTKTWAELAKWFGLFIAKARFRLTATALFSRDPAAALTWRIDQVPWSERNMEAFAGLHNLHKRILLIFDEASAIPDLVWETAEGALTDKDTEIIWCVFGNPTRNTGRFKECFGRFRHRWQRKQVDGRSVRITNKDQIAKWIADYGEDHDFVRVRVRGVFPRAGAMQFIPSDIVEAAAIREATSLISDPVVIGVDVARSLTGDQTVIKARKGRDARSFPAIKLRTRDTMLIAARVADLATELRADAVFIDVTGVGGGVVDRCRQLQVRGVMEVANNHKADRAFAGTSEAHRYGNKGSEMWGAMLDWLPRGAIENDSELKDELTGREYGYDTDNAIVLEKKDMMKKRLLPSPDNADALALTFAYPVAPHSGAGGVHKLTGAGPGRVATEYDPYDV